MKKFPKGKMALASLALTLTAAVSAQTIDGGTVASSDQKTEITTITGDGQPDLVRFANTSRAKANYQYLITDDVGNILAVERDSHDFEGASVGICRVYGISFEGRLTIQGKNAADAGLASGDFDVSDNWITVDRVLEPTNPAPTVDGGQLSGGPFVFTVDGQPDMVSGITLQGNVGESSTYVITDDKLNILGLPPTLEAVEGVDFDGAGAGVCLIWHLSYEGELQGAEMGANAADLKGNFDLSNSISVIRTPEVGPGDVVAGKVSGGPFEFIIDGTPDFVSGISVKGFQGEDTTWVITDDQRNILGAPKTLADLEGVNFDGAGEGVCLIWHFTFNGTLEGLEAGNNITDIVGDAAASSPIRVTRTAEIITPPVAVDGGEINGGPFEFVVDGQPDMVSGITLKGNVGESSAWVITDDKLNILGLPPTLEAVEGVDFDGAGAGVCLIWHLSYEGELEGAEMGANAKDLKGNFDLSNSIRVIRRGNTNPDPDPNPATVNGGRLSGGPFQFVVDGQPDMVSGITLQGNVGESSTFVITDDKLNILGLPPTLEAVEGVDFDGAGAGVCLIWHLSYEGELEGAEMGANAADLKGNFDLSNSIRVIRRGNTNPDPDPNPATVNGGRLSGGPFVFTVDGQPDMVSGITLQGNVGESSTYVITDDKLNILGLPPTLEAVEGVDFDGAGAGVCLIWHLSYEGELEGAEMGANARKLKGNFDLSNSIRVVRRADGTPPNPPTVDPTVDGGKLRGGPFRFVVGDSIPDMVSGIILTDNSGPNSTFVVTDRRRTILGLPPTLEALEGVDFDGAGGGVCFIYHLSYEDNVSGIEMGANLRKDLEGTFDLSNRLVVLRREQATTTPARVVGGRINGAQVFNFTVDGTPDFVSGLAIQGNQGESATWIITDAKRNILGAPKTTADLEGVDFDGAGEGVCLIWHATYNGEISGLEQGNNLKQIEGQVAITGVVRVNRSARGAKSASELLDIELSAYPNPANGIVTVGGTKDLKVGQIALISLTGQTLKTIDLASSQARSFDVSDIPAGNYIISVLSAQSTASFLLSVAK